MATYFERHKPRLHQWQAVRDPQRKARFHEATGTIVIHTFEANVSLGTKRAADFLVNRTDRQASYHALCGPASQRDVIQMAPWSGAAWHETHSNRWSIGISMVTQAAAWSRITKTQRDNLVASAAYAAYLAASWLKSARGITVPAKRITRTQAMNGKPGFISHGEMDPGRRHDPGAGFPWDEFLTIYAALMSGSKGSAPAPSPQEEDDMTPEQVEMLQDIDTRVKYMREKSLPAIHQEVVDRSNLTATAAAKRDAAIQAQITALARLVAQGSSIDVPALLAEVEDAAERGVKSAIDSIETTVTIKEN